MAVNNHIEITFFGSEDLLQRVLEKVKHFPFDCFLDEGTKLVTSLPANQWAPHMGDELQAICTAFDIKLQTRTVSTRNWNQVWESTFKPIAIESFAHIRADFHPPDTTCTYELIITPQMAFGTGHHQTTRLMISAMKDLDMAEKAVLDFGAGTGILGILSAKMGAGQVCCVENDPYAYENLLQNIQLNNVEKQVFALCNETPTPLPAPIDLMLVNITRNVILKNLESLVDLLDAKSHIILSGFHQADEKHLLDFIQQLGLNHLDTNHEDEWSCLVVAS